MRRDQWVKIVCGGLLAVVVGFVAWELFNAVPGEDVAVGDDGEPMVASEPESRLTVGVFSQVPDRRDIPVLMTLPLRAGEVNRAFRAAAGRECRMLPAGIPIGVRVGGATTDGNGSLGRVRALTIGIDLDPAARRALPTGTRQIISGYTEDHRIAITPSLYHDGEGKPYWGIRCEAAVFEREHPEIGIESEPMITRSMTNLRTLGVLGGDQWGDGGRTLVMAFRYDADPNRGRRDGSDRPQAAFDTELILITIDEDFTAERAADGVANREGAGGDVRPPISVYATSGGRQTLHELNLSPELDDAAAPPVVTHVKFDGYELMGMLPARPLVTGFFPDAKRSLPVSVVDRLLDGRDAALTEGGGGGSNQLRRIFDRWRPLPEDGSDDGSDDGSVRPPADSDGPDETAGASSERDGDAA